jgi:hypothetical protein
MTAKNILPKFELKAVPPKHDTSTGLYRIGREARLAGLFAIENATISLKLNCDGGPHQNCWKERD